MPRRLLTQFILACTIAIISSSVIPSLTRAQQPSKVDGQVTLNFQLEGGENAPQITTEVGGATTIVETFNSHPVEVSFSTDEPKEFKVVINQKWAEDEIISMTLSFGPLDIGKTTSIPLFKARGGLISAAYNPQGLINDSMKYCVNNRDGVTQQTKKYIACSAICTLLREHDDEKTKAAIRSFRGWFDAYYNLRINPESFLARDTELENRAKKLEDLARSNDVVRKNFVKLEISIGYFSGMIDNLNDDEIKVFNSIVTVVRKKDQEKQEALKQASIAAAILAAKHQEITRQIKEATGKSTTIVNKLRFQEIEKLRDTINRQLF